MSKLMIIGGAPRSLILFRGNLIRAWVGLGLKVIALAAPANKELEEEIKDIGADFIPIPIERDGINFLTDLCLIFKLRGIIKAEKPKYIFAYTVKPIIYSAIAAWRFKDIEFYFMITGLGYAFSGRSCKQQIIRLIITFLYKVAFKKSKVVFFQNRDDLELFNSMCITQRQQNLVVVKGSGVDTHFYYFSEYKPKTEVTFLLIARLISSKGIKNYVEASRILKAKYQNAKFNLLGPLSESPDAIVIKDLDKWQAEGLIDYLGYKADVRPYIKDAGIYVLPSYREGMPRSVLEAMSVGRPIITTDVPGCRETVFNGLNGFLVPVNDSVAIAEAMEKFILKPEMINTMGWESRKIVEEKFDVRIVNEMILNAMGLIKR